MEPISNLPQTASQQKTEETPPDSSSWKAFFHKFEPCQKKQFLSNMQQHFSQMISRQMRKAKEAMQKLKESYR